MTQELDISGMDYAQLSALRGKIDERVRDMRETEGPALRDRFMQQAAAIGMSIEELVQLPQTLLFHRESGISPLPAVCRFVVKVDQ